MTFKKEEGIRIYSDSAEKFGGAHIYPDMIIELVEEMLIDAPRDFKHIFGEVSFGMRGVDVKPLFYPLDEVIENTIKWFYLFKETTELYNKLEELPVQEMKNEVSSKRVLTKDEKEYILSIARGSKLPLIAAAKQVLTAKNIEFLRVGYKDIQALANHLENVDKGDLLKELEEKGLYPIKPKPDPEQEKDDITKMNDLDLLNYIDSLSPNVEVNNKYYATKPDPENPGKEVEIGKIDDLPVKVIEKPVTSAMVDSKIQELNAKSKQIILDDIIPEPEPKPKKESLLEKIKDTVEPIIETANTIVQDYEELKTTGKLSDLEVSSQLDEEILPVESKPVKIANTENIESIPASTSEEVKKKKDVPFPKIKGPFEEEDD